MTPKKHSLTVPDKKQPLTKFGALQEKLNKYKKQPLMKSMTKGSAGIGGGKYLYILLDVSDSMSGDELKFAKAGAKEFVSIATKKGYHVGLIAFESVANLLAEATQSTHKLNAQIDRLSCGLSTNMTEALQLGIQQLQEKKGTRVLWMVTDGYPDDRASALNMGSRAKAQGIDIICLGTESADHKFLAELASRKDLAKETTTANLKFNMKKTAEMLPDKSGGTLMLGYKNKK